MVAFWRKPACAADISKRHFASSDVSSVSIMRMALRITPGDDYYELRVSADRKRRAPECSVAGRGSAPRKPRDITQRRRRHARRY